VGRTEGVVWARRCVRWGASACGVFVVCRSICRTTEGKYNRRNGAAVLTKSLLSFQADVPHLQGDGGLHKQQDEKDCRIKFHPSPSEGLLCCFVLFLPLRFCGGICGWEGFRGLAGCGLPGCRHFLLSVVCHGHQRSSDIPAAPDSSFLQGLSQSPTLL